MRFRLLLSNDVPFELRLPDPAEAEKLSGRTESLHETEESAKAFAARQFRVASDPLVGEPVAMIFASGRLLWIGILGRGELEWRRPVSG